MDEKQLASLEKELMDQIDKEAEIEKAIEESSHLLANELIIKKRTRAVIDEKTFTLAYLPYEDKEKKMLCIFAINEFHFKMSNGNYKPYKIEAELDTEYSEVENLEMAIESFIRQLSGLIKPDEIQ